MANSGCPTHRKGAMRAALDTRDDDVPGEIEPSRRDRPPPEPVQADDVRDLAAKLAEKAMRALEEDMDYGEPRERQEAARTLAVVCAKLMGDRGDKPDTPQLTGEERIAAIVQAMTEPDAEMREAMRRVEERKATSG